MLRNKARKVAKILLILIIAIIGFYALLLFIVHMPPVQDALLAFAEKNINNTIEGEITIGSFRTNLINSITVYDIKVYNPGQQKDSISIQEVYVDYSLPALLHKEIKLDIVRIKDADIYLVRGKGGEFYAPLLPLPQGVPDTIPSADNEQGWELVIDSAYLESVDIAYEDRQYDIHASMQNVDSKISFTELDSFTVAFSTEQGYLRSPWWTGNIDTIQSRARISSHDAVLYQFFLDGTSLTVHASGIIPFDSQVPFNLQASVQTALEPFTRTIIPSDTLSGIVDAQVKATGTFSDLAFDAAIRSPSIFYRGFAVDSLFLHARYTEADSLQVTALIQSGYGLVNLTASAVIAGIPASFDLHGYRIETVVSDADVDAILHQAGLRHVLIRNREITARLRLQLRGDSLLTLPEQATLNAWVTPKGLRALDTIHMRTTLDSNTWRLFLLAGKGNTVRGNGRVRLPNVLNGQISGSFLNPRAVSSLFLQYPVTGALSMRASLGNMLQEPRIGIEIESEQLQWRGATVSALDGKGRYRRGQFILDHLRGRAAAQLHSVIIPGIDSLQGDLFTRFRADGTVPDISVTAKLGVRNPGYGGYRASCFEGLFRYNKGAVTWKDLFVFKDTLAVRMNGRAEILEPRRLIHTDIALRVNGKPAAATRLYGTWIGDSVYMAAKVDYAHVDVFFPDLAVQSRIEGTARIQAILAEPFCIQQGRTVFKFNQIIAPINDTVLLHASASYTNNNLKGNLLICPGDSIALLKSSIDAGFTQNCIKPGAAFTQGSVIRITARDFNYYPLAGTIVPQLFARGRLTADITATKNSTAWKLSGAAQTRIDTLAYPPVSLNVNSARASIVPRGTLNNPFLTFRLSSTTVTYQNSIVLDLKAEGRLNTQRVVLDTLSGRFERGGQIGMSGQIPFDIQRLLRSSRKQISFNDNSFAQDTDRITLPFPAPIQEHRYALHEISKTGKNTVSPLKAHLISYPSAVRQEFGRYQTDKRVKGGEDFRDMRLVGLSAHAISREMAFMSDLHQLGDRPSENVQTDTDTATIKSAIKAYFISRLHTVYKSDNNNPGNNTAALLYRILPHVYIRGNSSAQGNFGAGAWFTFKQ